MIHTQKITAEDIAIKRIEKFPDRPTLIFLHDSLGCIELWRDFPEKLAQAVQCNLLIYDRQGYGRSVGFSYSERTNDYLEWEADILNDLMQEWDLEKAILFGHSDGGSIALLMAAKYPEKIQAVIVEGAHIFVEDITLQGIKQAAELYEKGDLRERLMKYHGSKTDAMYEAWTKTWFSKEFRSWNIEHFLPSINCPLLFIQGEKDEYGTLQQVDKTLEQVSGTAQKFIVPKAGHTPHKEKPEEVIKKCRLFLKAILE